MSKSTSISAYEDCRRVMLMALERPGLKYVLETAGRAVNFKQRCNRLRSLLRAADAERAALTPGGLATCVFDPLIIRQLNDEGQPDNRNGRILVFDHHSVSGQLIDPITGETLSLDTPTQSESSIVAPDFSIFGDDNE